MLKVTRRADPVLPDGATATRRSEDDGSAGISSVKALISDTDGLKHRSEVLGTVS